MRPPYTGKWVVAMLEGKAKSARDNYQELLDPSRPSKLGKIPCQYAALRIKVSLSALQHPIKKNFNDRKINYIIPKFYQIMAF